jgi:hypothetical protein
MASELLTKLREFVPSPSQAAARRVPELFLKSEKPPSDRRYHTTRAVERPQQSLEAKTEASDPVVERLI